LAAADQEEIGSLARQGNRKRSADTTGASGQDDVLPVEESTGSPSFHELLQLRALSPAGLRHVAQTLQLLCYRVDRRTDLAFGVEASHENSQPRCSIFDGGEDDRLNVDSTEIKRLGKKTAAARFAHDHGDDRRITARSGVQTPGSRLHEKEPAQVSEPINPLWFVTH
jgi:hypothetical protein